MWSRVAREMKKIDKGYKRLSNTKIKSCPLLSREHSKKKKRKEKRKKKSENKTSSRVKIKLGVHSLKDNFKEQFFFLHLSIRLKFFSNRN